jgi:CxxC motif-containing protein
MWDNKEYVLNIIKKYSWNLKYASKKLRSDKEIVLIAVKKCGWILEYAAEELKADKEVVFAAVKNYGLCLKYASEELKLDKNIVLTAIKNDECSFEYASKELKLDKEVIYHTIKYSYYFKLLPQKIKKKYKTKDNLIKSIYPFINKNNNGFKKCKCIQYDINFFFKKNEKINI